MSSWFWNMTSALTPTAKKSRSKPRTRTRTKSNRLKSTTNTNTNTNVRTRSRRSRRGGADTASEDTSPPGYKERYDEYVEPN